MLKNYFKIAVRNLLRNKLYSFINIAGLAVGIASCLAILTFVRDEFSYDKFNRHADQIYRAAFSVRVNGHGFSGPASPAPLGPQVARDVPDVVAYTRLYLQGSHTVAYKNKAFNEEKLFWADSSIFDVFTIRIVEGDTKTALTQPNTIVINESTARRYFGNENPLGKVVVIDRQNDYVVTGVFKDFPQNSHFHPDFIASLTTLQDSRNTAWLTNNYYTYFLLRSGTNLRNFQGKLDQEVTDHAASQLKEFTGTSYKDFLAAGNRYGYRLQPLTSIHLASPFGEIEPGGYAPLVYVFSAIAIAILLIATINFINLATARSAKRTKEVGVRKSLGAPRLNLIRQFLAESILMTAISVVMAVVIIELFLPLFSDVVGRKMSFDLFGDPLLIPVLIGFIVVVGIVAGIYPAFYLSSGHSVSVLRSGAAEGGRKSRLRNALVVSQFAVSIILIIATFVIYSQMGFVRTADLGFNKADLLVVNGADHLSGQFQSFMRELGGNKNVMSLSNSSGIPSQLGGNHAYKLEGSGKDQPENTCV
ncbi:MAG: ABC transporter permease, partial [Bacteroidetes bacterium]|nr:ABC transporter permease [Bacteroidota bacterium]